MSQFRYILLPVFLGLLLSGTFVCCSGAAPSGETPDQKPQEKPVDEDAPENSLFRLSGLLPAKVEVTLDGQPLWTYAFTYDTYARLRTFKKSDPSGVLEDITVTPVSFKENTLACSFRGLDPVSLTVRVSSGNLVWAFTGLDNANRYVLFCDKEGSPEKFNYNVQYEAPKYQNAKSVVHLYEVRDGNVTGISNQTGIASLGAAGTSFQAASADETVITYSSQADVSNMGAFLLANEFLPWFMKGVPGNRNLPSLIEHYSRGVKTDRFEDISYRLVEANDAVLSMTVKYYRGTALLHTYVYMVTY